jgi:PAS domain S-box-containing protein
MGINHRLIRSASPAMNLRVKFRVSVAAILLLACIIGAFLIYHREKGLLERNAYATTELVMAAVEASRAYVREELRPAMYAHFGEDFFLLEAMSTSYVGRAVAERYGEKGTAFQYRRIAVNARNPVSEADPAEREMIAFFRNNPERSTWQGLARTRQGAHYMRYPPVYFEEGCLRCHGDAHDAPPELIAMYGDRNGFGRYPGELAGLITVGIPVHDALADIRERTASVFLALLFGVSVFYLFLIFFFDRIVVNNLRDVLGTFHTELDKDFMPEIAGDTTAGDEIQALTAAVAAMAGQLRGSRQALEEKNLALEQEKDLLQSVFDGITDMVVLVDRELRVQMVNRAYLRRNGIGLEDVYGRPCYEVHAGNRTPCDDCLLQSVIETGRPVSREFSGPRGELFLVTGYPVLDESGRVRSIIRYGREITDQKNVALKIQQAEKLVAIGQLAAGVAHEINNPLGVILCYADLLKRQLSDSAQALSDLGVIEKQTLQSRRIVADLLQFSRSCESARRPARLNRIIDEVVPLLSHQFRKRKVQVVLDLDERIPEISLDEGKIRQVLINILINAGQAIEEKGRVTIATRWLAGTKQVQITIRDDGHGIDPSIKARIFDPFFTTKGTGQGTGLGLAVSYGIIQDHGGEITVESRPGRGACFMILLPAERP